MIHAGIDLHSRNMTLVAPNDNGDLICEVKTESNTIELERFFRNIDRPVQAAVECTSYWYWVADRLEEFLTDGLPEPANPSRLIGEWVVGSVFRSGMVH